MIPTVKPRQLVARGGPPSRHVDPPGDAHLDDVAATPVDDTDRVHRQPHRRVVETPPVTSENTCLSKWQWRRNGGFTVPVADQSPGHHRGPGDGVDVAHRSQAAVGETEQCGLGAAAQEHGHAAPGIRWLRVHADVQCRASASKGVSLVPTSPTPSSPSPSSQTSLSCAHSKVGLFPRRYSSITDSRRVPNGVPVRPVCPSGRAPCGVRSRRTPRSGRARRGR